MIARITVVLLVCGMLAVLLEREADRGAFESVNRRAVGWLFPAASIPAPVVLVSLRDGTPDRARAGFDSWPPGPLDFALIFEALARRHPRAVAVESLLDWPRLSPLDASTLAERATLLPRGVFACLLQNEPGPQPEAEPEAGDTGGDSDAGNALVSLVHVDGDIGQVPAFTKVLVAPAAEIRGSRSLGFTRIDLGEGPQLDGWNARMPLLARQGDRIFPSLPLQTVMNWQGVKTEDVRVRLGREITLGPGRRIPIDASGAMKFDIRYSPGITSVDAGALLLDESRDAGLLLETAGALEALRSISGAVAVVGDTSSADDEFKLPRGGALSQALITAQSIGRVQTGNHVREIPRRIQRWAWGLIVMMSLVQACLRPAPGSVMTVVVLLGLAATVLVTFRLTQVWLPPVELFALALAGGFVAALVRFGASASHPRTAIPDARSES
jgi:hypothetical protein